MLGHDDMGVMASHCDSSVVLTSRLARLCVSFFVTCFPSHLSRAAGGGALMSLCSATFTSLPSRYCMFMQERLAAL